MLLCFTTGFIPCRNKTVWWNIKQFRFDINRFCSKFNKFKRVRFARDIMLSILGARILIDAARLYTVLSFEPFEPNITFLNPGSDSDLGETPESSELIQTWVKSNPAFSEISDPTSSEIQSTHHYYWYIRSNCYISHNDKKCRPRNIRSIILLVL